MTDDDHTGTSAIIHDDFTARYTYEHVDKLPEPECDYFRITTLLRLEGRPLHKNVYFYPGHRLSRFFDGYGQTGEVVVDVRPCSARERDAILSRYED